ncbi:sigma non-opioid intracellular receptor 1-like isoform X1 [Montipora capricornis]|uniref:sigma non-opioid intracellular receptor 1-like isoform X1 n=1 Tax=Montipora capricornis TaxID=246305 RepID=UPI0035F1BEBF
MAAFSYIVVISLAIFGIQYWLNNKSYIFEAGDIARIAERHARRDASLQAKFSSIALEFERKYPGHILPEEVRDWMFVNCGGWMGSIHILHASLTEYLLFFGTAIDTSGNSGRYWANISFTILNGSLHQWKEGTFERHEYSAGETMFHGSGKVCGVQYRAGTWTVEYGRGFIPSTLGFALADSVFSTMDFVQIFRICKMFTRSLVQETLLQLFEIIEMVMK